VFLTRDNSRRTPADPIGQVEMKVVNLRRRSRADQSRLEGWDL